MRCRYSWEGISHVAVTTMYWSSQTLRSQLRQWVSRPCRPQVLRSPAHPHALSLHARAALHPGQGRLQTSVRRGLKFERRRCAGEVGAHVPVMKEGKKAGVKNNNVVPPSACSKWANTFLAYAFAATVVKGPVGTPSVLPTKEPCGLN
jgi:hypothetical protein